MPESALPWTDEELADIRADADEPWQNSHYKETVDRWFATIEALKRKAACPALVDFTDGVCPALKHACEEVERLRERLR